MPFHYFGSQYRSPLSTFYQGKPLLLHFRNQRPEQNNLMLGDGPSQFLAHLGNEVDPILPIEIKIRRMMQCCIERKIR